MLYSMPSDCLLNSYVCVLYVGKKPTEVDIWRYVIAHVGKNWRALLTYLGVPANIIEREEIDSRRNVKEAFFQSLLWWQRGNSKEHPATWKELLQAVEFVGFKNLADDLSLKLLHDELSEFL